MNYELDKFIEYIKTEKKVSLNTEMSYKRDLNKLCQFELEHGVTDVRQINSTNLTSYILYLEEKGFSPATISRTIASIKSFVAFLVKKNYLKEDVSAVLKAPKIKKKKTQTLSEDEIKQLLMQPDETVKGLRDKAMIELLYSSGLRVTQLIELKVDDVNLKLGYITCEQQTIKLSKSANDSLDRYLKEARASFVKDSDTRLLFYNCSGSDMSRQGFWKMLKSYGKTAGIQTEITPHTIRSSLR